jgi:hypothetical protein
MPRPFLFASGSGSGRRGAGVEVDKGIGREKRGLGGRHGLRGPSGIAALAHESVTILLVL